MPTPLPAPALLRRLDNGPVSADLSAGLRALAKDCGLKLDPDAELDEELQELAAAISR